MFFVFIGISGALYWEIFELLGAVSFLPIFGLYLMLLEMFFSWISFEVAFSSLAEITEIKIFLEQIVQFLIILGNVTIKCTY